MTFQTQPGQECSRSKGLEAAEGAGLAYLKFLSLAPAILPGLKDSFGAVYVT